MAHRIRRAGLIVSLVSLVASFGCTGNEPNSGAGKPASPATDTVATPLAGPDYDRLDQLWTDMWAAVTASDPASAWAKVDGFTADNEQFQGLRRYAYSTIPPFDQAVDHNLVRSAATATGTVTLDDCLVFSGSNRVDALHFAGSATWSDGRWALNIVTAAGGGLDQSHCVPAAVNDAVIGAYRNFVDALQALALQPDPDSPLVNELTTDGPYRAQLQDWLAGLKANGEHAVTYHTGVALSPEVYGYTTGLVSVADCVDAFTEFGQFKADGSRSTPAQAPDTRAAYEVDFSLVTGKWLVNDVRTSYPANCAKSPSSLALAIVG
jgi:hypothetical protein